MEVDSLYDNYTPCLLLFKVMEASMISHEVSLGHDLYAADIFLRMKHGALLLCHHHMGERYGTIFMFLRPLRLYHGRTQVFGGCQSPLERAFAALFDSMICLVPMYTVLYYCTRQTVLYLYIFKISPSDPYHEEKTSMIWCTSTVHVLTPFEILILIL